MNHPAQFRRADYRLHFMHLYPTANSVIDTPHIHWLQGYPELVSMMRQVALDRRLPVPPSGSDDKHDLLAQLRVPHQRPSGVLDWGVFMANFTWRCVRLSGDGLWNRAAQRA